MTIRSEFETTRLHIRPLAEADETLYCGLYTDAETMRFIGPPLSAERAARSFKKALQLVRGSGLHRVFFTITERASGQAIGICSLQGYDEAQASIEAGIILHKSRHSRGFATEAFSALLAQAFDKLPVRTVWSEISAENPIVERMVRSVGLAPSEATAQEQSSQRVWSAHRDSWLTRERTP